MIKNSFSIILGCLLVLVLIVVAIANRSGTRPPAKADILTNEERRALNKKLGLDENDGMPDDRSHSARRDLFSTSTSERAILLGQLIPDGCVGSDSLLMGSKGDDTYWSVKCSNGKSYSIQIGSNGKTKYMDCAVLKAVARLDCSRTFEEQR